MKKRVKTKKIKHLLDILGVDPNELVPANLEEARMIHEEYGGNPIEFRSNVRLNNDCNKVCYSSEAVCRDAINHRLRCGSNSSFLRAYRCETCSAWHMSSSAFYS